MEMKTAIEALEAAVEKKEAPKDLGFVVIERMCLIRDDMTISIPNIARLAKTTVFFPAVKETTIQAKIIPPLVFLLSLLIAHVTVGKGYAYALAFVALGIAIFVARRIPKKVKSEARTLHRLHVHTNDGGAYMFFSYKGDVIDGFRRIVTDKMNGRDEAAAYNINFERGVIQNMDIGKIGSVGAIVTGDGNQVVGGAGHARVNTTETVTTITRVDYAEVLPFVAQWKEYLETQNHQQAAERFAELERLLKAGTPTKEERYKLRDLLKDLGAMFKTSTNAIELFDMIRKLAGLAG